MNEQATTAQAHGTALTDDELSLVVGGSTDPNDPVGDDTGGVNPDLKATPILF